MNYTQSLKYIYSREMFGIKLGLKNISELMLALNNPQDKYRIIHVAGTNGKGSVCSFIANILQRQGYRVGLYTSPHLVDFRERIMVNGKKITKKEVSDLIKKIKPKIKDHTYFELVTALAFLYFKKKKLDFAVMEVGMGGRLDATNIVKPIITVITNIELEHTEYLGDIIEKIAFEKAGIIKPKIPIITSEDGKGLKIIKNIAKKRRSKLYIVRPKNIYSSLYGDFQKQNVSLALKVIELLKKRHKISKQAIISGINSARWPGRFEFVKKNLIFDCAHNPAGAIALAKELKRLKYKDIYLILGIMKDKDIKAICNILEPLAKEIILTKPNVKRAADPKDIAKHIKKKVIITSNIEEALEYAKLKAGKRIDCLDWIYLYCWGWVFFYKA